MNKEVLGPNDMEKDQAEKASGLRGHATGLFVILFLCCPTPWDFLKSDLRKK